MNVRAAERSRFWPVWRLQRPRVVLRDRTNANRLIAAIVVVATWDCQRRRRDRARESVTTEPVRRSVRIFVPFVDVHIAIRRQYGSIANPTRLISESRSEYGPVDSCHGYAAEVRTPRMLTELPAGNAAPLFCETQIAKSRGTNPPLCAMENTLETVAPATIGTCPRQRSVLFNVIRASVPPPVSQFAPPSALTQR